jgi:hypothetical protein
MNRKWGFEATIIKSARLTTSDGLGKWGSTVPTGNNLVQAGDIGACNQIDHRP